MSKFLIDTNVLSEIFKNNQDVTAFVESIDCVIDATVYMECLQGSKSNAEKASVKSYLDTFSFIPYSSEISDRAIRLIDQYSNSHGLLLPDALIAASALENGFTIVTYNLKDFKFIAGLNSREPST